ncbi:hypothetical protein M2280_004067 [Prescottella agglutinans]|uniref:Uncharacterized protein n=1 Tax=Prescottella agglutinans TaxID=1644129 RepID=A0ABT6MG11_9NOCA|nr:hypothetical protein [Prescottella agglutinans]
MAPLLSRVGRRNWNCRCCNPAKPDHGRIRQREKRVTQKWLDEYENREPIFCPWTYIDDPDEVGFAACNC